MSRKPASGRRGLPAAASGIAVPADKRFRRSAVRPRAPRRWRRVLVRSAAWAGAAAAALAVAAWAASAFLHASVLRVDRVVVRGHSRLSVADVEARLEGIRGESVLLVDLERYQRQLLGSPWIAGAELWRVLPSTVEVRIVERAPLAIARMRGELHLVAADGVLLDRFGPSYRQFDLPIVDGLFGDEPAAGAADAARLDLVRRLFADLSARPDLFRRLSQVDVSDPRNAVVLIDDESAELRLGDTKFRDRLERWEDAVTRVEPRPRAYWELRFDDEFIWAK